MCVCVWWWWGQRTQQPVHTSPHPRHHARPRRASLPTLPRNFAKQVRCRPAAHLQRTCTEGQPALALTQGRMQASSMSLPLSARAVLASCGCPCCVWHRTRAVWRRWTHACRCNPNPNPNPKRRPYYFYPHTSKPYPNPGVYLHVRATLTPNPTPPLIPTLIPTLTQTLTQTLNST